MFWGTHFVQEEQPRLIFTFKMIAAALLILLENEVPFALK